MHQRAVVAFGGYLKLLRERRQLSLDDVVALTKAYPEPLNKGYLSRAERGLSHFSFSKIVALARAYEVPIDVLGEKWSLDLEVESLKEPPKTEGISIGDLMATGAKLSQRGARLEAYAIARVLVLRAGSDTVASRYTTRAGQIAAVTAVHGIAAGGLSRLQLSQHEVQFAQSLEALETEDKPIASIQLSALARHLGNLNDAQRLIERAIAEAGAAPSQQYLGHALASQGLLATKQHEYDEAIEAYKKAFAHFRQRGSSPEAARTMLNLAVTYVEAGRLGAARRAVTVAHQMAKEARADGVRSRARVILGDIEALQGHHKTAVALWMDALDIAKSAHDRVAAFYAEFHLFRHALAAGHTTAANAFGRRLNRLWPWISPEEPEVQEFRALWATHRPARKRRVAAAQHGSSR